MEKSNKIRDWVETLPKMGRNVFTLEEIIQQFPMTDAVNIRNTLYRLTKKSVIQSVWHGFYVIIPAEYGLKGIVPPTEYIDLLMKHLGKKYYVGLLNAAALHGAAHQQPQEFTAIVNDKNLRGKAKKGIKINFITRYDLPTSYLKQLNTRNGFLWISSAELTAMDLIYYMKEIGGVSRATAVLNELAEVMDLQNVKVDFFSYFSSAVVQRLGYILDDVLGYEELADVLYQKAKDAGIKFRKYPLKNTGKETAIDNYDINEKWKIIINEKIEIDE
jgi:predicted transcriptional regulator of viral defense system